MKKYFEDHGPMLFMATEGGWDEDDGDVTVMFCPKSYYDETGGAMPDQEIDQYLDTFYPEIPKHYLVDECSENTFVISGETIAEVRETLLSLGFEEVSM